MLLGGAVHDREPLQRGQGRRAQTGQVGAGPLEHGRHDALAGVQQGQQQVRGLDRLVGALPRECRGGGERLLGADGGLVDGHSVPLSSLSSSTGRTR